MKVLNFGTKSTQNWSQSHNLFKTRNFWIRKKLPQTELETNFRKKEGSSNFGTKFPRKRILKVLISLVMISILVATVSLF